VRRLVLLWAVRSPSPPGYRTCSSQTESTEDTSILAAERQSPEYQAEGWRLVSGRACGAADLLSTRACLSHPGGELQTGTHASTPDPVPHENQRRCSELEPRWPPGGIYPESCQAVTRCARTNGCLSCNPRHRAPGLRNDRPAGCA